MQFKLLVHRKEVVEEVKEDMGMGTEEVRMASANYVHRELTLVKMVS